MSNLQVRAIVGARVSHVPGAEKTSHLVQHETGGKYCAGQGWDLVGSFEDLDVSAISTSPWDRPDLGPWLKDRAHEWDALVVSKTDRLFRSAKDSVDLAHWAEENQKILVFVDDGIKLDFYHPEDDRDPWSSMMAKVFLLLSSIFAEMEGRRYVQRARDRVRFLRGTDRWGYGVPPYGYVVVDHPTGPGKALGLEPSMQTTLHDIADRLVTLDNSLTHIAASLNNEGVPSPIDARRRSRNEEMQGAKWTSTEVRRILSSPATQGIKVVNGKPALDLTGQPVRVGPPSFTTEVWDLIQRALEERRGQPRQRRHSMNPLLGVGQCAVCRKGLTQQSDRSSYGTYRYYRCAASPRCPGVSIPAADAEELVEQTFLEQRGNAPVVRRVYQIGEDHTYELDEVLRTIKGLREDRALGLFATPDDELVYRDQMKALIARRDDLGAKPHRPAGWVQETTEETYAEVWKSAGPEARRKLLVDAGVQFVLTSKIKWDLLVPQTQKGPLSGK